MSSFHTIRSSCLMSFICSSAALHTKLHICTQTNFHSQVEMIDGRWISTGQHGEIHQFGSRGCVMVSYRRSALKVLRCYLCCSILGKSMHIQQVHHSTHAHMSTGCKNSPSFREFRLFYSPLFPNNIKKPFDVCQFLLFLDAFHQPSSSP